MDTQEPTAVDRFTAWFRQQGGFWHPTLYSKKNKTYGSYFATRSPLPGNTKIIACPAHLVITREKAIAAFQGLGAGEAVEGLNERQLVAGYVAMHLGFGLERIRDDPRVAQYLQHEPYISTLPTSQELLTPFQWNEVEISLLEGLNLGHAVGARRELWRREWEELGRAVVGVEGGVKVDWDDYLLANTYISSRAFPSTLLDPSSAPTPINPSHDNPILETNEQMSVPANEVTPESYPVLIPGLDTLNHRRNQAVTWVSVPPSDSASDGEGTVGLVLRTEVAANKQVFNNYGPKGNEELILGYGFSIEKNPDDTLALKLGIPPSTLTPEVCDRLLGLKSGGPSPLDKTWYIPRSGMLPEYLFDIVRIVLSVEYGPRNANEDPEVEMQMTGLLLEMIGTKTRRMREAHERNEGIVEGEEVRAAVWDMVQDYVQGQLEIMETCNKELFYRMEDWQERADYLEERGVTWDER